MMEKGTAIGKRFNEIDSELLKEYECEQTEEKSEQELCS